MPAGPYFLCGDGGRTKLRGGARRYKIPCTCYMKQFCVKCRDATENGPSVAHVQTANGRTLRKAECKKCGITKTQFVRRGVIQGGGMTQNEETDHYARLAASSYEKPEDRQGFLEKHESTRGWVVDQELSDNHTGVYVDPRTKQTHVSFRGSAELGDWAFSNSRIVAGTFHSAPQFKKWEKILAASREIGRAHV